MELEGNDVEDCETRIYGRSARAVRSQDPIKWKSKLWGKDTKT